MPCWLHVPIQEQISLVHSLKSYFFKIRFDIVLPPTPVSFTFFLSFRPSTPQKELGVHFSYPPKVHDPNISSSLMWSPEYYLQRCKVIKFLAWN